MSTEGVTVLHRELVEAYGYTGSYTGSCTSLRRRVVELRPTETDQQRSWLS